MNQSEAKKFLLVDSSQLKSNDKFSYQERTKPLPTKELQSLDVEMLKIVNDPNLSTDEKVQKYNTALTQFQKTISYTKPLTVIQKTADKSIVKQESQLSNASVYNPTKGISLPYQNKVSNLWSVLKNDGKLKVSRDGSVTIKDELIPGSNITDMLYKAVNPRIQARNVVGWTKFKDFLTETNVPTVMLATTSSTMIPVRTLASKKSIKSRARGKPYHNKTNIDAWMAHDLRK